MSTDKDGSKSNKDNSTSIANGDVDDGDPKPAAQAAIEKLERDRPEQVTEIMAMMGQGPVANPLHRKMNEDHITQVLELAANHDERQYTIHKDAQKNKTDDNKANRRYAFAAFVLVVGLLAIILVLFKDQPTILVPVITGLGGLAGGFLGGWGFGHK